MIAALLASVFAALQITQAGPPALADDLAVFGAGLRACGITAQPEFTEESPMTREYWITVTGREASEASAECLALSPALDSLMIDFTDPNLREAFGRARMTRPDIKAAWEGSLRRQSEWLEERGLLADRPRLAADVPVSAFSVAVERHCGLAPGAVLQADDETRALDLTGEGDPTLDQITCVFSILSLAVAEAVGVTLRVTGEDTVE